MKNKAKSVIAINEETGEKIVFSSINEAARKIGTSFQGVQIASMRNGVVCGWRIFDSPDVIREKIEHLQEMLEYVENNL